MLESISAHESLNVPTSTSFVRDLVDKSRSNKCIVETNFSLDFLTIFLIEDFDVNSLIEKLCLPFCIKEDPKIYEEAMRSIDASF